MTSLFQIITFLLFSIIVYYAIFIRNEKLLCSIYPYLWISIFFSMFVLTINNFIEQELIILLSEIILATVLLFLCYILFQADKNLVKRSDYQIKHNQYEQSLAVSNNRKSNLKTAKSEIAKLIQTQSDNPLTYHNQFEMIFKEERIFAEIFQLLQTAKDHIHLQFYIIRDDKLGKKLKNLLLEKAKEGVEVRVIYDAVGSKSLSKNYSKTLKQAGVKLGVYNSFVKSLLKGKLNNRLHRKLIVVDGKKGFSSDLNIGTEYIGKNRRKSVGFKLEGKIVNSLQKIFLADWYYIKAEELTAEKYFPVIKKKGSIKLQVLNGDYDSQWNEIEQSYHALITKAKKSIYLVTPYLTLSSHLISALQLAALKGVEIKIIIAKKTNNFLIDWANSSSFSDLLKADIKIFYYNKQFLHTKVLIIDQQIMTLGSANFNNRSLYLDCETNIVVYDQRKTKEMLAKVKTYLKNSQQVNKKNYLAPTISIKLKNAIGNIFAPLT